ncbi:hypothetical protein VI817_001022 [Penicillium citrinum]|uniref:Uncharacterized protein n=1 Tax=Penicillium hetheringtonii TaxID=911720 RepID=A0AAD6E3P0_9EURO|nr:hypothetical protein N7450_000969 [Penicillium hetheringtonii]KAK5806764.1 hypothetical protein VI817_001022 [Penicillium citrinum]
MALPTRAIKAGVDLMEIAFLGAPSKITKIFNCNGSPGDILSPRVGIISEKLGLTMKVGGKYTENGQEFMKINIVPNNHAQNPSLRDLARNHPNKIVSQASIKTNVAPADHAAAAEKLFKDLSDNVLDR